MKVYSGLVGLFQIALLEFPLQCIWDIMEQWGETRGEFHFATFFERISWSIFHI